MGTERRVDQLIQQCGKADDLVGQPIAGREQVQHSVECLGVLYQQDQVGAAAADGQHQVEHPVERAFVRGSLVQPGQEFGHEAVEALVRALAERDPLEPVHEYVECAAGVRFRVDILPPPAQAA